MKDDTLEFVYVLAFTEKRTGIHITVYKSKEGAEKKAEELVRKDAEHWKEPKWKYDGSDYYQWGESNSVQIFMEEVQ